MNSYTYHASDSTIQALTLLLHEDTVFLTASDRVSLFVAAGTIAITSEPQDFETNFECCRISAEAVDSTASPLRAIRLGKITRIRLLESEEWIEPATGQQPQGFIGQIQAWQSSGPPGSAPSHATAKCGVNDGVLISATFTDLLISCDLMIPDVSWSTDPEAIHEFIAERALKDLTAG